MPHDGLNYSAAEEMLIKEFGVVGIGLSIPEAEDIAQTQENANRRYFDQAVLLMMNSFFDDYADPASPLSAILAALGASAAEPSKQDLTAAKRKLLQLMNMPGSMLRLVRASGAEQPARGERVKKNWIVQLRLDHYVRFYRAIGDRLGKTPVYNYGS